ncbi:MAG TPA: hypothetical protein VFF26_12910 [Gallionella sp.]|nr:hypothetical protein [Gallionella sp.]
MLSAIGDFAVFFSLVNLMSSFRLMAIVEVAEDKKIRCQAEGCGHSVYKRIHVVRDGDRFIALGSECFKKLCGDGSDSSPHYGYGNSKLLTDAERALPIENTRLLIEAFEREYQKSKAIAPPPVVKASPPVMSRYMAEEKVKEEMRAEGINPELPGWRGFFELRVKKMMQQNK